MAHNTDVFSAILEIKTLHSTTHTHTHREHREITATNEE